MNNGINLIGTKDHESVPAASRKLIIIRSIAVVLLFGVSAASIVLYILITFSPLPQVQQQERDALASISVAHPEMTKIALLDDRMKGISAILAKRNKYDVLLDTVSAKLPANVVIYQLSISERDFALTVKTNSLEALTTFVDRLQEAVAKKEYKAVTINTIISDSESDMLALTISIAL